MNLPPVSLVIPVYNERRGLPPTLEKLRALLPELPDGSEIILVDDGSTDGSRKILDDAVKVDGFRLAAHHRNRGYGAALKTGIHEATHEHVAIADADGTYPVDMLPGMLERLVGDEAAMVIGARPRSQQPAVRRPAKAILRWLAEYLTGERIPDMNSGLRVFHRSDVLRLKRLLPNTFSFTTTITMALLTEGKRVIFTPIPYRVRLGSSKIKPVRDTANFVLLICRTALAFNPMKVFGPVGAALIAGGVVLLLLRLLMEEPFGVATTVFFLIGGLQIFAIGLLADLVNRRGGGP